MTLVPSDRNDMRKTNQQTRQTGSTDHLRTPSGASADITLPQHRHHPRDWQSNHYVYPVISRRSRGLSIGVNLNPDAACNFDCVYCQVDRTQPPRVREVIPDRLGEELLAMVDDARSGALFDDPMFAGVPAELRRINDIAFSGDGEPTTCKHFVECVEIAASIRRRAGLDDTGIVLITDACYLTRPAVMTGLAIMDRNNGEIWAKLDAGTEDYYRRVNRPNYPLAHVIENITDAARVRPVVIQSLFMRLGDQPPDEGEIAAYCERLAQIIDDGGQIARLQVYTVARSPAESFVTPLSNGEVDRIAQVTGDRTGLAVETFYGTR